MYLHERASMVHLCVHCLPLFAEYNQQGATFLKFIYFCNTLYMFQTVFPSTIRSSKLHIERQVFVRPILLTAASRQVALLVWQVLEAVCVQFWSPDDGWKNRPKYVERLTYLLTYLFTPWSRVLLEKLASLQLVKKFPAFYGTRRFLTALCRASYINK